MINFRTDLADERTELLISESANLDGITSTKKKFFDRYNVNIVKVLDANGSKVIDKKIGTYITIDIDNVEMINNEDIQKLTSIFSIQLSSLLKDYKSILIVGLGNEDTTADSIGPQTIKDIEITRHILKYNPELYPKGTIEVSAIAPGVLGTTGIETQEVLKGIIHQINFDAMIVIDALASNNVSRLMRTIQLCDTGIVPGSGVENKRKEISFETMGLPVIAIGVPTVVNVATIVADTLDIMIEQFSEFSFLKNSSYSDKYQLVHTVLEKSDFNLTVMPKEIDELVDNMEKILSEGINKTLKARR